MDVRRRVRREPQIDPRELLGRRHPAQRRVRDHTVEDLLRHRPNHLGRDEAGSHSVDPNADLTITIDRAELEKVIGRFKRNEDGRGRRLGLSRALHSQYTNGLDNSELQKLHWHYSMSSSITLATSLRGRALELR